MSFVRNKNKPYVLDNRFFVLSLVCVVVVGLYGVLLFPFAVSPLLFWFYFRRRDKVGR